MRLIYAEEAIKSLMDFTSGKKTIGQCIDDTPTASIEQKTGHWIEMQRGYLETPKFECSECGKIIYIEKENFCPKCGKRMVE